MLTCKVCHDEYGDSGVTDSVCCWCAHKSKFAEFAKSCGLKRFPDPTGERYVYLLNGQCAGKKSEEIDFIDELWAALVRATGGDKSLIPTG